MNSISTLIKKSKKIDVNTLNDASSLYNAMKSDAEEFNNLKSLLNLTRQIYMEEKREEIEKFTTTSKVGEYLTAKMGHLEVEQFHVLILNNKNRKIGTLVKQNDKLKTYTENQLFDEFFKSEKVYKYSDEDLISIGTVNQTIAMPREVFKKAITMNASSIILAHNHPSGDITPSNEDKVLTRRMVEAGEILGINVLDHFVIGHNKYYSFKENGDL